MAKAEPKVDSTGKTRAQPSKSALPEVRLGVLAALVVLVLAGSRLADRWELPFRDLLLSWAPHRPPRLTAAVVVDEQALARFGRFPWPRERLAQVVEAIRAAGARGLVVDLLLAEPAPGDPLLASALSQIPAVLAVVPTDSGDRWLWPSPPLAAAARLGHATFAGDHDGVVRRLSSTQQLGDRMLPALAWEAVRLVAPSLPLPVGRALRPDFRTRARAIPQVSVNALLEAQGAHTILKGRVVFLGVTAAGLGDRVVTPTSVPGIPDAGVLVQAAFAECLYQGGLLQRLPPWGAALAAGLLVWAGAVLRRRAPLSLAVTATLAVVVPLAAGVASLLGLGWETPLLTLAATSGSVVLLSGLRILRHIEEATQRLETTRAHPRLSPEERVAQLLRLAQSVSDLERQSAESRRLLVHELKTPLAGLKGLSQLLSEYELSPEEHQRVGRLLAQESSRLAELVETLLELENLTLRPFPPDAPVVDLEQLVRERVELFRAGTGRNVQWQSDGPAPVRGVSSLLARVVDNLLANAHKFSPPEAPVMVRLSRTDQVLLEVEDRGPGIAPEEQERIFQRFVRGQSAREVPGLGLGLSVVREVVTWHGGRVGVRSTPGAGSTFTVVLPLSGEASRGKSTGG
ncbi:Sensor-like histidine kinase senX3 [bacterium HR09]|nr:Sensor-like histidine kinase senX3 [bacterium HR09]